MKVLTLNFGPPENRESIEVHMLNVGDVFEGFGGSRHPLVAGRDFNTGERQKKPTASLVTRRQGGAMGLADKELHIHDQDFWKWIARLINDRPKTLTATDGDEPPEG